MLGVWAVFRTSLATDDSFAFNKTIKQLRTLIEALPAAEEHEDAVLATALAGPGPSESPVLLAQTPENVDVTAWDDAQALAARRQALLDCMLAAKAQYVNVRHGIDASHAMLISLQAWAHTTVDMLVLGVVADLSNRFTAAQQPTLQDLKAFVQQQRIARRTGKGAKPTGDGPTTFEKARAAWGHAEVSKRGKVGAGGDSKSAAWLG